MPDTETSKTSQTPQTPHAPKSSLETLTERWSDEKLLHQAALRRKHLNYRHLYFGDLDADKEYLISLLPQIHNTYYMGHFQACMATCGSFLEAALCKRTCWDLEQNGPLEYKPKGPDRPSEHLETTEDIHELSYQNYLGIARYRRWLSREECRELREVWQLRNQAVHNRIPVFHLDHRGSYRLELEVGRFVCEITIPAHEVEAIATPPEQITAWYCLRKARHIVRSLLEGMQKS